MNIITRLLIVALVFTHTAAQAVNYLTNTVNGVTTNAGASDFGFPNFTGGNKSNLLQVINGGILLSGSSGGHYGSVGYGIGDIENTILVTGSGSAWTNAGLFTVGSSGINNRLIISNQAAVIGLGSSSMLGEFIAGSNNYAVVTDNALWVAAQSPDGAALRVGNASASNSLFITQGGDVRVNNLQIGSATSASNNYVKVAGAGSTLYVTKGDIIVGSTGPFNRMDVLDGAVVTNANIVYVGAASTSSNNLLTVSGTDTLLRAGSTLSLTLGANNQVIVSNGAVVSAQSVTVTAPADNKIIVTSGGILEGRGGNWSVSGTGNIVSNNGGVFQFTTVPSPGGISGGGVISMTDGTLSFKGLSSVDVLSSVSTPLSGIAYFGNTTFRLNSSSNATANQTYTFNTGLGASHFMRLEMINGETRYRGGNITIGSGGSMLLSNTLATITGLFTNNGMFTSVHSAGTFQSAVFNNGGWVTDPTTNTFLSDYTVSNAGSISMAAGDVYTFKSNFINQSLQNTTYNTTAGKFQFNGGGPYTQTFATAGIDLGPGPTPATPTTVLAGHLPANDFALGTLELTNGTQLIVSDAFPGGDRAALYLDNLFIDASSRLIVSNNVTVYFVNSNDWTASNFSLLGDAELHQLVPEPSLLLLLATGCAVICRWRRR